MNKTIFIAKDAEGTGLKDCFFMIVHFILVENWIDSIQCLTFFLYNDNWFLSTGY